MFQRKPLCPARPQCRPRVRLCHSQKPRRWKLLCKVLYLLIANRSRRSPRWRALSDLRIRLQTVEQGMPKSSAPERAGQFRSSSCEMLPAESPTSDVVILCWNAPTESDRRAQEIAAFLGATVQFVALTAETLQRRGST